MRMRPLGNGHGNLYAAACWSFAFIVGCDPGFPTLLQQGLGDGWNFMDAGNRFAISAPDWEVSPNINTSALTGISIPIGVFFLGPLDAAAYADTPLSEYIPIKFTIATLKVTRIPNADSGSDVPTPETEVDSLLTSFQNARDQGSLLDLVSEPPVRLVAFRVVDRRSSTIKSGQAASRLDWELEVVSDEGENDTYLMRGFHLFTMVESDLIVMTAAFTADSWGQVESAFERAASSLVAW